MAIYKDGHLFVAWQALSLLMNLSWYDSCGCATAETRCHSHCPRVAADRLKSKLVFILARMLTLGRCRLFMLLKFMPNDYPLCNEKRTLNLVGFRSLDKLWFTAGNHHLSCWNFRQICVWPIGTQNRVASGGNVPRTRPFLREIWTCNPVLRPNR